MESNCRIKIPIGSSSSCLFKLIGQLCTSLDEGYVISCITLPGTNEYSIMVDIIDSNDCNECQTVFGDEAIARDIFIRWFSTMVKEYSNQNLIISLP